ncbi:MAG: type III-B CRISPR module-associated Cmr3 family protein [Candidatus Bathyarchaeia archaeon]
MREVASMIFRFVEPMMFRGPGEFDPFVRGTYSRAMTLPMPSPSTVAGTLATYYISEFGGPEPSSGDWLEQYLSVLGTDIEIRGPLIKLNHELMAEDRLSGGFLTMDKIRQKCEGELKKLSQKIISLEQLEEYLKGEKFKPDVKVQKNVRVGIGLQIREKIPMKSVKKGFLYSAEYLDYTGVIDKETKEASVEVIAEIRGRIVESLSSARALPVKFGGEGRVAILSFQEGGRILDEIKERLWYSQEKHYGLLALYLSTPALFKGGIRVEKHVRLWAENMNCRFMGLSGESSVLGAGFMIKERRRKPVYTSFNPGSIIFLEGSFDLMEMYRRTIGEASMLGYGTPIPIPIAQ